MKNRTSYDDKSFTFHYIQYTCMEYGIIKGTVDQQWETAVDSVYAETFNIFQLLKGFMTI